MKRLLSSVLLFAVLLSPEIWAQGQSGLAPGKAGMAATLKDGQTVQGAFETKTIKIKTAYGYSVVKAAALGSITFGDPDVVLTTDGTEISGKVEQRSFRIKVGKARKTLRRAQLVTLSRTVGGAAFDANSFGGAWSTNYGPLTLEQTGTNVKGTWGYRETKVKGKVQKGELSLTFQGGTATLELAEDGALLLGEHKGSSRTSFWGGYRIQAKPAPRTPGEITTGQTKSWLNYHLRVPKGFKADKNYPAIAFLHGSNMSSRAYVNTIASVWPEIAKRYILVGFDGENLSRGAKAKQRAYNFSYVNFSGHERGPKSVQRQSPALVAEALDELKSQLPITHWFLGGHSQGGFLTYAVYMFYPDKVAGVFPMSCNLLIQCDPDYQYFQDQGEAFLKKQREVAIAVIHGENDNVVAFSGGESCFDSMVDGGFPMVHFFKHPTAAHMFARLPVDKAIAWLEGMTTKDATTVLSFAEERFAAGHYRDASAAVARLRALGVPSDLRGNVDGVSKKIDAKAKKQSDKLAKEIRATRNNGWVDGFLEFRDEFAFADVAKPVMAAYGSLRDKHAKPADKIFWAARGIRDKDERNAKYREIVDKYYASKWYRMVKGWVEK